MEALKHAINWLSQPWLLFTLTTLFLLASFWKPRFFYGRAFSATFFALLVVFFALSMLDPTFRSVVLKPDNVPIAALLFIIPFFVWLGMAQAVRNDERIAAGKPPAEKDESEKVFCWPNLVYIEFIFSCVIAVMLFAWSISLRAPLEPPANPAETPNPSKAPWYFLGLQEMLVYFDPWLAGVVLPTLIIVGLIAIPYIDVNPKGNGYYTFRERKWEIGIYLYGFIILWVMLVVSGTFLRGPNWNFFGPYEVWDVHKVVPLKNVNVSELVWIKLLGQPLPQNPIVREIVGIALLAFYFGGLPLLLARTWCRRFYVRMGFLRYMVGMQLFLWMLLMPIKMYLRWLVNLKYILAFPEIFFNI